jgi:TolB-like protein
MKRTALLFLCGLLLLAAGFGLGLLAVRHGFVTPVPRPDTAREPEANRSDPASVTTVAILPFTSNVRKDDGDFWTATETLNANLPKLVEDNTGLRLVPLTEEVRIRHDRNPIAAGRALNAEAVLAGNINVDPFVGSHEFVSAELLDVRTGRSVWSMTLRLRERDDTDRFQVLPRLQRAPGEIVHELGKRWPRGR